MMKRKNNPLDLSQVYLNHHEFYKKYGALNVKKYKKMMKISEETNDIADVNKRRFYTSFINLGDEKKVKVKGLNLDNVYN